MAIDPTVNKTTTAPSSTVPASSSPADSGATTPTVGAGNVSQLGALAQSLIEQGQELAAVLSQTGGVVMGQAPQAQAGAIGIPAPDDELLALLRDGGSDNMAMLMTALNTKTSQNQLDSAMNDIKANQGRQSQLNADRLQKIQESIQKEKDAQPGFWGKFFGWVGKIASLIASVATIVAGAALTATGVGAAAGIALMAVGVMGTISTIGNIVNEFLPDDKKMRFPLSIGGLIGFIAEKAGMDPEKAQALAGWIDVGITILTAVVLLVPQAIKAIGNLAQKLSSKLLQGMQKLAQKATDQLSKWISNPQQALALSRWIGGLSGVAGGASSIGAGVIASNNADTMKESRDLQAQAQEILARLTRLQTQSEQLTESVNQIVDAMQTAWTEGSKIINQTLQNAGEIAANAAAPVQA